MSDQIEIIKGGWFNVPGHLICKTALKKIGLKPGGPVKAQVWNSYMWVNLYDKNEAVPKRKPTRNQLAALEQGRQKLKELNTCPVCKEEVGRKRLNHSIGDHLVCDECYYHNWIKKQQQQAEETFCRWYNEDFVILDTETTGLDGAEIVEIAIIDRNGNVLFDSLVKPKYLIPHEVTQIHGIINDMVYSAATWVEKWDEIKTILHNRKVLIYNDSFDTQMINNTNYHYGITPIQLDTECVMRTYAMYIQSDRWLKLSDAADIWTSHRALGDCFATLKVITNVWRQIGLINELKETS